MNEKHEFVVWYFLIVFLAVALGVFAGVAWGHYSMGCEPCNVDDLEYYCIEYDVLQDDPVFCEGQECKGVLRFECVKYTLLNVG